MKNISLRRTLSAIALLALWAGAAGLGTLLSPPSGQDHAKSGPVVEKLRGDVVVAEEPSTLPDNTRERDPEPLAPQRLRTCLLHAELLTGLDGELHLVVTDAESGDRLFDLGGDEHVAPASVVKLFTAVAALRALGPDYRFTTRVVQGDVPSEIWLVGGGDVTLTRSPGSNYYASESHLDSLARQTVESLTESGVALESLRVDSSRYDSFLEWDESWRPGSAQLGFVAPVTALQVDGDRDQPAVRLSPRSSDPVGRATMWFAEALSRGGGVYPTVGAPGVAPVAPVIAEVRSAPLESLISTMILDSDNSLAEVIAREVALQTGISSIGEAILSASGLPDEVIEGEVLHDGSGLSGLSEVSGGAVTALLKRISSDEQLGIIRGALPVAGQTGSLQRRFASVDRETQSRIYAKTGSIRGVRSLAGFAESENGESVAFSVVVVGPQVNDSTRRVIDDLVVAISQCGENLRGLDLEDSASDQAG